MKEITIAEFKKTVTTFANETRPELFTALEGFFNKMNKFVSESCPKEPISGINYKDLHYFINETVLMLVMETAADAAAKATAKLDDLENC